MTFTEDMSHGHLKTEMTRELEKMSRILYPNEKNRHGKFIMLGERIEILKPSLDKKAYDAFKRWNKTRSDYEHNKINYFYKKKFIEDYEVIYRNLDELVVIEHEEKSRLFDKEPLNAENVERENIMKQKEALEEKEREIKEYKERVEQEYSGKLKAEEKEREAEEDRKRIELETASRLMEEKRNREKEEEDIKKVAQSKKGKTIEKPSNADKKTTKLNQDLLLGDFFSRMFTTHEGHLFLIAMSSLLLVPLLLAILIGPLQNYFKSGSIHTPQYDLNPRNKDVSNSGDIASPSSSASPAGTTSGGSLQPILEPTNYVGSNNIDTEIRRTERIMRFNDYEELKFDPNANIIKEESYPYLNYLVNIMRENPDYSIVFECNTDNVGAEEDNKMRSQELGDAVKHYFLKKGIAYTKIFVKPYGSTRPKYRNDSADGRAKNRRVEIYMIIQRLEGESPSVGPLDYTNRSMADASINPKISSYVAINNIDTLVVNGMKVLFLKDYKNLSFDPRTNHISETSYIYLDYLIEMLTKNPDYRIIFEDTKSHLSNYDATESNKFFNLYGGEIISYFKGKGIKRIRIQLGSYRMQLMNDDPRYEQYGQGIRILMTITKENLDFPDRSQ